MIRQRRLCLSTAILFAVLLGTPPAFSQTHWTDATGNWFTAGNWDNGVPTGSPPSTQAFIDNGGTAQIAAPGASASSLLLGSAMSDSGTLEVSGTGTLSLNLFLSVAASGTGTVIITGGGSVSDQDGSIAFNPGSTGMVAVAGSGSKWTNVRDLSVGEFGNGELDIVNGGAVSNANGTVGRDPGSTGLAKVDGTNSKWTNNGDLIVGDFGTGTLFISNGGTVSDVNGTIAYLAGTMGTVRVFPGGTWTNSGNVSVGEFGQGELDIVAGSAVSDIDGIIGHGAGSSGTATVDGPGSTWTNSGSLTVGNFGNGALNVTSGGTVSGGTIFIANEVDSTGTATVNGVGSVLKTTSAGIAIGFRGNGTLNVKNGGLVMNGGNGEIGSQQGSVGLVNVDGAGSKWTNGGNIGIASDGTGTMNITNGGEVTNVEGYLGAGGFGTPVSGTATVDGSGSKWTNSSFLKVGQSAFATGTLHIQNGGLVSDTNATIGDAADSIGTVTVDGAGSTWTNTFDLNVGSSGTGTLGITNGATVSAANTTIGNLGTAIVDATLSSTVDINGGTLAGTGTVVGNATNSGVVSPGDNSAGTLTILGGYTQNANGTLRIEIGGIAAGQHDLLSTGSSSLNGTLQLLRINNFNPLPGNTVTILTSGIGDVSGTFSTVLDNFGTLVKPNVIYETKDVLVQFVQGSFNIGGLTPNQLAVAHELNEVTGDPRATNLIDFLDTEPLGNLPHDYDLLAPEELASIYEIGFSQAVVQNNNLEHRMDDIRAGSNGFCASGYQMRDTHGFSKGADGKTVLDKNPTPAFVPTPENPWGVFVTGSGDFVNVNNNDDNAHGYDITTGDVTVGVDYRLGQHFAVGLDGGYSGSTADLVDNGQVSVNGGKIGGYATVYGYNIWGSVIHVDGAIGGGWNSYDTRRTGLQDDEVRGSTNGSEFNAMLAYGGDWHFGCLLLGTWDTLQYTNIHIDKFTESGSLAPLQIQDQNQYSLRGTTGARLAYDIKAGSAIIRPEARVAWMHESGDQSYPIDARFASGAGDVFTVHGPKIGRDAALVDAGVAVQWSRCCSFYVYYDGVLGRSNYTSNAVSGGFRVSF